MNGCEGREDRSCSGGAADETAGEGDEEAHTARVWWTKQDPIFSIQKTQHFLPTSSNGDRDP
eukprot:SAG22_NODE_98_length_20720_cov_17.226662_9_plen_62_part_00